MEQQVLDQFREITHFDDETEGEKVERLLNVCNWNLETALARYFDNDFPQLFDEVSNTATTTNSSLNEPLFTSDSINSNLGNSNFNPIMSNNDPFMSTDFIGNTGSIPLPLENFLFTDTVLPKLQRAMPISNKWKFQLGLLKKDTVTVKRSKFFTSIIFLLMLMPKFLFLTGYYLNKLLGNFAPGLLRILGFGDDDSDNVFPAGPIYNTVEEVSGYKIDEYITEKAFNGQEEEKGKLEKLELPIFKGEFNEAYEEARSNFKWLCVLLFNSKSPSTEKLIVDMLTDEIFINFIKKYDIVLYVGDICYPEPFEVAKTYKATQLPYLLLIANVSLTGLSTPEFSIVSKYSKLAIHLKSEKSTTKICKKLDRIVSKYEPQLISQRFDKQEMDFARILREQQDLAYQESLLKDKQNQELKEQLKRQEELEIAKIIEKQNKLQAIKYHNSEILINYINNHYRRDSTKFTKGEYTTIQFRSQNGNRFIRKFLKNETLLDIFMYVASKHLIDKLLIDKDFDCISEEDGSIDLSTIESEDELLEYFSKYEFKFVNIDNIDELNSQLKINFDLVSPMPRLKLEPELKELNKVNELWPNGSLLIEMNEEEDEEDEDEEEENVVGDDNEH